MNKQVIDIIIKDLNQNPNKYMQTGITYIIESDDVLSNSANSVEDENVQRLVPKDSTKSFTFSYIKRYHKVKGQIRGVLATVSVSPIGGTPSISNQSGSGLVDADISNCAAVGYSMCCKEDMRFFDKGRGTITAIIRALRLLKEVAGGPVFVSESNVTLVFDDEKYSTSTFVFSSRVSSLHYCNVIPSSMARARTNGGFNSLNNILYNSFKFFAKAKYILAPVPIKGHRPVENHMRWKAIINTHFDPIYGECERFGDFRNLAREIAKNVTDHTGISL